jgi:hypothetical protein
LTLQCLKLLSQSSEKLNTLSLVRTISQYLDFLLN